MSTLAKSLHTVSALVNVALYLYATDKARGLQPRSPETLTRDALLILGYSPADDAYGLRDVAARKIARAIGAA